MASSPSTSSGRSDLPPTHSSRRQHDFKDVLVFNASGGVLSLRRITLEQHVRESRIPFASPITSLATSISLPGVGAAGWLSASPPRRSGLTQQMLEAATELVGKDSTVATWQLKRRHDWGEVKRVVYRVGDQPKLQQSKFVFSLSSPHAELSTCARSPGLVPHSIYISHQFLFYTLGEDYHALIRRYRVAISGAKIDVRKEVGASAFTGSSGAHFVEDLAFPSDQVHSRSHSHSHMHAHGPSSAMSAEMAYDRSAVAGRATILMLPNGAAQQLTCARTGTSWSSSGTRAALSGMSMGRWGMIRREMHRVRGGREREREREREPATGESEGRVPLEFDEEDEDFGKGVPVGISEGDGEDLWRVWSEEDRLAVDEAERFDD
ncbi:hypothetical protein EV363DRAFT_1320416, partial [Boletus edulis]